MDDFGWRIINLLVAIAVIVFGVRHMGKVMRENPSISTSRSPGEIGGYSLGSELKVIFTCFLIAWFFHTVYTSSWRSAVLPATISSVLMYMTYFYALQESKDKAK